MAVVTTNLGVITAYGDAVAAGYTGTKAQWQALMADYATVGQQAAQDAQTASTAATTATTAAQTATTKASEASASATAAAASAASITTPDATLTQAGVAADAKATGDEISDLKEELTITQMQTALYNAMNLVAFRPVKSTRYQGNATNNGITYEWHDDNTCSVSGTASSMSFNNIYSDNTHFPSWLKKGETYVFKGGTNVSLEVYFYKSGTYYDGLSVKNTERECTIPADIDGLIMRLQVANGVTVSENVSPICRGKGMPSNAELLKVTENINDALTSASKNIIVTNNNSDFGDGGCCVFDVSDYAIKRGYEKDDGSRIFPVPSINAPVSRDIPKREILSVIKSYVDRTDMIYGDVDVPEGDPKPGNLFSETVDTDASGNHYMNCVAFVGAIVKGIKYEKSRYVIDKNVDSEYSTYRNMPQSISQYFSKGWLTTFEIAQYFAEQKQLFYTNADAHTATSRLQFGDVLFISMDTDPYNIRFLKLSHCLFVLGVIPNTNCVVVAENTSTGTSFFNESAGRPFINIRNINSEYLVFARPNYNLPYSETTMYKNGNKTVIKPYMIMGATINIDGDTDVTQRGYIFTASKYVASCRDYIPVAEGSKLDYVGALSDGGNLHTVRAVFYDENLNYIRHFNLAYGGTASQATVNANEKYVRFMFQMSPMSYAEKRPLKINDIYNFTVEVS